MELTALSAVKQSVFRWAVKAGAGTGASLVCVCVYFSVLYAVLFRSEMKSRTLLACGPLVLEDCVDVIHFAQPLEEWDEVQQLGVGHVVEPRGYRHCVVRMEDVGGWGVVHDDDLV